jgi:hypothetical protein
MLEPEDDGFYRVDRRLDSEGLRALREEIDWALLRNRLGERRYRITQLTNRAVQSLRDIEDYAVAQGWETDDSPNALLASRVRVIYEKIRTDIIEGSTRKPTEEERQQGDEDGTRGTS